MTFKLPPAKWPIIFLFLWKLTKTKQNEKVLEHPYAKISK